jgi:hypothetical protein
MIIGFMTPICNIVLVSCNELVCMVIVEDESINYEASSTLQTLSSEYSSRVRQNTPIFSNLLKLRG